MLYGEDDFCYEGYDLSQSNYRGDLFMKNAAKFFVIFSGLIFSAAAFAESAVQSCVDKVEKAAHDQAEKDMGLDLLAIVPSTYYPAQVSAMKYKVELVLLEQPQIEDLVTVYWVSVDDACNLIGSPSLQ